MKLGGDNRKGGGSGNMKGGGNRYIYNKLKLNF